MALYYKNQITSPVIGSKKVVYGNDGVTIKTATRTEVALTASYPAAENVLLPNLPIKSFRTADQVKLNLDISYTMGASETGNSIQLKIESSPDNINWYRIPNESVSTGTSTLTAREFTFVGANAANATISIGLDIFYKYMRVSAKETIGSTNFGTTYIEATLSGL